MRLLFRASVRYFLHHPWQLILAVSGIALGVAVVAAVEIASVSAQRAFQLSMTSVTGEATHQIVGGPAGLDDKVYTRLRLAGIRASAPLIEAYGVSRGETLHLFGVDPFAEGVFRRHLRDTQGEDTGTLVSIPNTALLAAPTAARLSIAAGDSIELRLGGRVYVLKILGLIDAGAGNTAAIDGLLITDIATAQELTGLYGRLSWIDVKLPQGQAGTTLKRKIEGLLPPDAELVHAESRTRAMEQMTSAFQTNLTAMSLLALVVGMFLIYNTMTFAVIQRRTHIACQRLIGVSRREVVAVVLVEALAIGGIATLLGLAAGIILGHALLSLVAQTINDLYFVVTVSNPQLSPGPFIYAALLGLGATLAAALVPALEASLTPPRAALHRSVLEARSRSLMPRLALAGAGVLAAALLSLAWPGHTLVAGFAGLFLLILGMAFLSPLLTAWLTRLANALLSPFAGISIRLAIRGIIDALSRTGVALAALMLAVATTVGVGLMIESFRATVSSWLEASLQADIYVSAPGFNTRRTTAYLDPRLIDDILKLPMIRMHSTGRAINLESGNDSTRVFVLGLSPGLMPRYPLKSGKPAQVWPGFQRGDAVLISEPLAWHRGLASGDTIELRTDHGVKRFPIAGLYYDYGSGQGEVLMPRALYERHFDDHGISGLGLYLQDGADPDRAMESIRAVIAGAENPQLANLRSNRELRALSMNIFNRTFTITEVLRLLAVTVAIIGIMSALMALQLERSAEIAVLRAIGFTPGQVYGMVTVQTALMGLIAGLIALPTGVMLALLLIHVINVRSFGWTMHTLIPLEVLAGGLFMAIGAALAAGLYPAWKLSRISPAAALRDE